MSSKASFAFHTEQDGTRLPHPFLNITDKVYTSYNAGDERGLLGLAFHPHFYLNNKFYIYYSVQVDGKHKSRISELKVMRRKSLRSVALGKDLTMGRLGWEGNGLFGEGVGL